MRWPSEMVDAVVERTGGVPLFVEELTRLMLEARRRASAAGARFRPRCTTR